jgi:hypothetical protein
MANAGVGVSEGIHAKIVTLPPDGGMDQDYQDLKHRNNLKDTYFAHLWNIYRHWLILVRFKAVWCTKLTEDRKDSKDLFLVSDILFIMIG